jgi:hypothetical protein
LDSRAVIPADSLLGAACRLYAASFLRCLPLALLGTLASGAAGAFASAQVAALSGRFGALLHVDLSAPDQLITAYGEAVTRAHALLRSPAVWVSYVGAALIVLVFHGALVARQHAVAQARAGRAGRAVAGAGAGAGAGAALEIAAPGMAALGVALRRVPAIVLVLVIFAAAAAAAVLMLQVASAAGLAVLTLLGLVVTLLAVWLWGRLQLWLTAMFAENVGAAGAIGRSWTLVRGHWVRASALTAVPYLLIFVFSSVTDTAAGAAAGLLTGHAWMSSMPPAVLSLVSGALTLPMLPAVWLALYYRLRDAGDVSADHSGATTGM